MTPHEAQMEMRELPLQFTDPMVRANLAGRKTNTRRPVKLPRAMAMAGGDLTKAWPDLMWGVTPGLHVPMADGTTRRLRNLWLWPDPCRLWVKEAHAIESSYGAGDYPPPYSDGRPINRCQSEEGGAEGGSWWEQCHYRATDPAPELDVGSDEPGVRWRSAMFMPRWAARTFLVPTLVKVEHLHDIREADAVAEGVRQLGDGSGCWVGREGPGALVTPWLSARDAYRDLWESIHGVGSWDKNPWVWSLHYTVSTQPAAVYQPGPYSQARSSAVRRSGAGAPTG